MTACSGFAVAPSALGPAIVHHPGEASVRSPSQGRLPGFGEVERRAGQGGAARVGWPSPAHPEDAIDAAEQDLAQIRSLYHLPEEQTIDRHELDRARDVVAARYADEYAPAIKRGLGRRYRLGARRPARVAAARARRPRLAEGTGAASTGRCVARTKRCARGRSSGAISSRDGT